MSLPSQGGIGFGGATRGRRRRGGRGGPRKLLIPVVVVALVGGVVWLVMREPDSATADNDATAIPTRLAQEGTSRQQPLVPPQRRAERSASPIEQRQDTASRTTTQPVVQDPPPQSRTVSAPVETIEPAREQPAILATPAPIERTLVAPAAPSAGVATLIASAEAAIKENKPVVAREYYNRALLSELATESDRVQIREQMAALNEDLIFSPRVYPNDPFTTSYTVESGDSLSRIAQNEGVATEWLLIQRVNRLAKPSSIFAGQSLKLVRGPFHAVVSKSEFRMDVYIGPQEDIDQWVYVRSFDVGLGEFDGTPLGVFTVRRHSKLINPFWRNPRTGEEFEADNPDNPIGEHWIGLRGLGEAAAFSGYGIHGTVEPDSIGQEMSMGCVRMLPDDVALVYELLSEQISEVHIIE